MTRMLALAVLTGLSIVLVPAARRGPAASAATDRAELVSGQGGFAPPSDVGQSPPSFICGPVIAPFGSSTGPSRGEGLRPSPLRSKGAPPGAGAPGPSPRRPGRLPELISESARFAENGFPERAERLCERALLQDPLDPEAHVLRVRIALARGRLEEAMRAHAAIPRTRPVPLDGPLAAAIAAADLDAAMAEGAAPGDGGLVAFREARRAIGSVLSEAEASAAPGGTGSALRRRAGRWDDSAIAAMAALAQSAGSGRERQRIVRALRREALAASNGQRAGGALAVACLGLLDDSMEDDCVIDALRAIRTDAPSPARRALAERVLGALGVAEVADALVRQIVDDDPGALEAARALGALRLEAMLPRLRPHLDDPRPSVRNAAAVACARSGGVRDAARELVACLLLAREAGEMEARAEIASAVGAERLAPVGFDVPALEPAIEVRLSIEAGISRAERMSAEERARTSVAARLRALHEAYGVEVAGPGLLVVALRPDLDGRRFVEVLAALAHGGHAVSPRGSSAGSLSSTGSEESGPSP